MSRKRYKAEEYVVKLRQVDVLVSQGRNVCDAIHQIRGSEVMLYHWRREYGGLKTDQVSLKELETEDARFRRAVSDLTLDRLMLQEAARGNYRAPRVGVIVAKDKRVERVLRRELMVPAKLPKRRRLWLVDGSCIRLRSENRNHVWSYNLVEDPTHDGRKYRKLNIVDEFTGECLAIRASASAWVHERGRCADRVVPRARGAGVYPFRQRSGVRRQGGASPRLASGAAGRGAVPHAVRRLASAVRSACARAWRRAPGAKRGGAPEPALEDGRGPARAPGKTSAPRPSRRSGHGRRCVARRIHACFQSQSSTPGFGSGVGRSSSA